MKTIKGNWLQNSDDVFASQHQEFLFIDTNGARWINQEPGEIAELLETMSNHPLDVARFGDAFIQPNPCRGVAVGNGKYVDGYFNLIEKHGRMIAKTLSPQDAKMIIDALEKAQS